MVILIWTQFNIQKLGMMLFCIVPGNGVISLQLLKRTVSKRVAPFVMQKYGSVGCHFIIKQHAGQRWRDSVVFWRDHTHDY